MNNKHTVYQLCECAVMIALGIALSYIDIQLGFLGGSINLAMIPIIVFSLRYGFVNGLISGIILGTLKFIFAGGVALNWESMLLDYTFAYAAVGFAGCFKNMKNGDIIGTAVGGFGRFFVHFISGVTIYADYAEQTYFGINTPNIFIYSLVYNGIYMLPSIIISVVAVPVIMRALNKYFKRKSKE